MFFPNAEKAFAFAWCNGYEFDNIHDGSLAKVDALSVRVCYMTTQVYRIYLVFVESRFEYWPFQYRDSVWRKLNQHSWAVKDVSDADLESLSSLQQALSFQMILQFRDSVDGFYYEFPEPQVVLDSLGPQATVSTLDALRYTFHPAVVQDDEEWDGAVEVQCKSGVLLIPFKESEDGQRCLVRRYATYVPDSKAAHLAQRIYKKVSNLVSPVRDLHWSNLRFLVESRGGSK